MRIRFSDNRLVEIPFSVRPKDDTISRQGLDLSEINIRIITDIQRSGFTPDRCITANQ